jgi:pyrimidine operon attenuation protein/uracil phosphoribosyltransferase
LIDDLKLKIENIENEMDIRVESMIIEIQNYRDDYRLQLDKYKKDFEKYIEILNADKHFF